MPDAEVLLVGPAASVAAGGRWSVVSRAGPAVIVLRADLEELPELARAARLAIGRSGDGTVRMLGDESAIDALDPGTRLFVQAWREKPSSKPRRPGEGLSWDAPGFEPPDRPKTGNR